MIYDEELVFKINRRSFVSLLLIATIIIAAVALYLQWDQKKELVSTVSVHVLATLIVALFIAVVLLYKKAEENREQIKILEPGKRIDHELNLSRANTEFWYFSGGTGTETRKITLPTLGMTSRIENSVKQVKILIINPGNQELIRKYCSYRLRNFSNEEWTERKVQLKIYASILACLYWEKNSPLEIELLLKNNFSAMRFDISEERLIISKGDPKEPAFLVSKPNVFYNCVLQEFHQIAAQSQKLDISLPNYAFKELIAEDSVLSKEILISQFKAMGIEDNFTDKEFEYIVLNAKPDFRRCKINSGIVN